jgi:hypothetical protein
MNSLLDDSRMLTLANGNRLNHVSNVKMFFETNDLTNISSPAVTRLAFINFPNSQS